MPRRKASLPPEDDGRTIASMNVEGMPWYTPDKPGDLPASARASLPENPMTGREIRMFTWGAVKAALLVVGVICLGIVLLIALLLLIWTR